MRYLFGLLLLFIVVVDFSATCLAEGTAFRENCLSSLETSFDDCSSREDEKTHSNHTSQKQGGHCHLGHVHLALVALSSAPIFGSDHKIRLSFLDYPGFITSSFLKEVVRPPIQA